MSWEIQGRQDHGWFGHGTGPGEDRTAGQGPDGLFDPGNLVGRVAWIAHAAIGHLPRTEWKRPAVTFDRVRMDQLQTSMAAWSGARSLDQDAFERLFTQGVTGEAAALRLRAAADNASAARTHEALTRAGTELAGGMLGVELDRWPSVLRQVAERAGSVQHHAVSRAPAPSTRPAQPLPNGYQQQPGDKILLARMMFTEAANSPLSYAGIGWAALNRIGSDVPHSGKTLSEVIYSHGQFQGVGSGKDSLWALSADPANLQPGDLAAYNLALKIAAEILEGRLLDPTGGATTFYSGDNAGPLSSEIKSKILGQTTFFGGFHFLRRKR